MSVIFFLRNLRGQDSSETVVSMICSRNLIRKVLCIYKSQYFSFQNLKFRYFDFTSCEALKIFKLFLLWPLINSSKIESLKLMWLNSFYVCTYTPYMSLLPNDLFQGFYRGLSLAEPRSCNSVVCLCFFCFLFQPFASR